MNKFLFASLALVAVGSALAASSGQGNVAGTWLLNGKDKSTRWVFNKDGTFLFKASNASSRGKWSSDGSSVKLVWTQIDSEKVKPGTVKATYPLSDGALKINKFNYRKFK